MSWAEDFENVSQTDYAHIYRAEGESNSLEYSVRILRASFDADPEKMEFDCENMKEQSIVLRDEVATMIYEYDHEKMIVHILQDDLLIIENFKQVRLLKAAE